MPEKQYRWTCPHDWFVNAFLPRLEASDDPIARLREMCVDLVHDMDPDTLQDLLQKEMDNDGYFEEFTTED